MVSRVFSSSTIILSQSIESPVSPLYCKDECVEIVLEMCVHCFPDLQCSTPPQHSPLMHLHYRRPAFIEISTPFCIQVKYLSSDLVFVFQSVTTSEANNVSVMGRTHM